MTAARSVTATFNSSPVSYTLTVSKNGTGGGTVTSNPAGISCGSTCSASYASGQSVTLTASADSGSTFAGWSGACSGTGTCTVNMTQARTITASFTQTYTVTPSAGTGGSISPNTAQAAAHGTTRTFTVTPNTGYTASVGGTCGGTLSGTTYTTNPVTANCTVAASFNSITVQVLANNIPVTGLSGGTDSFRYFSITVPTGASNLTITTNGGDGDIDLHTRFGELPTLADWDCRPYMGGNSESCSFPTPQAGVYYIMLYGYSSYSGVTLTASYTQSGASHILAVSKNGTGLGTVTSNPAGISCGSTCSASYASGQSVTLTASADSGSTFAGWSGDCSGTGACTVSMTAAHSVTATFNQQIPGSLSDCLDNNTLTWTTGGDAAWFCQADTSVVGGSSAQSESITDDQEAWIETTVVGPGTLRFYWRVSSEDGYDFLKFSLNGVERASISGETAGWAQRAFVIPEGAHALRWTYSKDGSVASGADAGWLDKVDYTVKTGEDEEDASWLPAVKMLLKR